MYTLDFPNFEIYKRNSSEAKENLKSKEDLCLGFKGIYNPIKISIKIFYLVNKLTANINFFVTNSVRAARKFTFFFKSASKQI